MASTPALTTTFEPPSECLSTYYFTSEDIMHGYIFGPQSFTECYPPGWAPDSNMFFSPGLHCPKGYVSACQSTNGGFETVITCCPSSFSCQSPDAEPFFSQYKTWSCTSRLSLGFSTTTVLKYFSGTLVGPFVIHDYDFGANAYSVQIRFQAKDLASVTTPNAISATVSSTIGSENNQPTATVTVVVSVTHGSLAAQQIAKGIGIGIAFILVVLLMLFGAYIYFRRVRKRKQRMLLEAPLFVNAEQPRPVINISPISKYASAHAQPTAEQGSQIRMHEINAERQIHPAGNHTETSAAQYYETTEAALYETTARN